MRNYENLISINCSFLWGHNMWNIIKLSIKNETYNDIINEMNENNNVMIIKQRKYISKIIF